MSKISDVIFKSKWFCNGQKAGKLAFRLTCSGLLRGCWRGGTDGPANINGFLQAISTTVSLVFFLIFSANVFAGEAVLSWDSNDWTIDPDLAGYKIYYGAVSGNYTSTIDIGLINPDGVPTYTVNNLAEGNTYYFVVTAYDTSGNESGFSNEVSKAITITDTTPPGDVQDFTAVGSDQQITISWTNPSDPDFAGVRIRYRTDHFPENIEDGTLLGDFAGKINERIDMVHAGLQNGVTYYYSASSYDGNGNFQSTAFVSGTPSTNTSSNTETSHSTSSGGCGMIIPKDGKPPGPGKMEDVIAIAGVFLWALVKKGLLGIQIKRYWHLTKETK